MLVKRYHADDMQQVMDMVIRELGSDAIILSSRKIRKKGLNNLFHKKILEVMVAYEPANVPVTGKANSLPVMPDPDEEHKEQSAVVGAVSTEYLERLDRHMSAINDLISGFMVKLSYAKCETISDYPENVQKLLRKMFENQVEEEPVYALAKEADVTLRGQPGADAADVLEHLILDRIGRPEPIQHKTFSQKVVLVIGPTGVGKTTTIVKLAADFSVKQKKKPGIINTDTYKIGAQEQLQTYADIIGIPLQVVYRPDDLEIALDEMSDRDIIFVDTAGKRTGDEQYRQEILDIVRILKPEDILLCLSSTTSAASIKEMIEIYGFVGNYRLLVTKLDETKYRGSILNISWYAQKPLAYVTTGQNVPDDIEVANVESITKHILGINV